MKTSIFLSFLLMTCLLTRLANAQDIYIDKKGNDKYPGTKDQPLATLQAARERIRKFKSLHDLPKGGITVWINEGNYNQGASLVLDEKDSGLPGCPITWTTIKGAKVNITGGINIPAGKFRQVNSKSILDRLTKETRKNLWQVNLNESGIHDYGKHQQFGHGLPVVPAPLELYFNDNPMVLARYPNDGYLKIGKVIDKGSVPRIGDKSGRGAKFMYEDPRHSKWAGQKDIWLQGTFNYGFADDYIPVDTIDPVRNTIKLSNPHLYGVASGKDFQHYIATNILDELDAPGEWYLDRKTGILYFWPPANLQTANITVSMLEDPIISLEGASYITLNGLTVETGRGIGIYIERGNNNLITGCTVRNVGTSGIFMGQGATQYADDTSIDDYDGTPVSRQIGSLSNHLYTYTSWDRLAGHDHGIISCDVYNTGSGGIYLSGGSKRKLIKGNNYVDNCKIHDYNRRNKNSWSGINVDGCGNKISHCEIYNSDWQAIFVHGNDHVFEYNNIHDVTLNSDDTSPWYIGRDPSDRGNIIRYNYFHHCGNPNRMNMGIYCDDSSTDVYIFGNVFNDMSTNHGVLFSNTGWDLVMKNNIVVNPISYTAAISAHYYTWAANEVEEMFGKDGLLRKRLTQNIRFNESPYAERYPSLLPYLDTIVAGKEWAGMRSRGNALIRNVIVGGADNPVNLMGGEYATMKSEQNFVTKEDPGFVDFKNGNFMLKPDAKVFQMIPGFELVPFDKMGLYKDEYRN
ncbi:right-handed parallel beta-helix repeat-containing protein [Flavihumibacter profundi]|uniref:right-handed parallel beta-helix repeat-containing protein n=1 Tax=Flavihumibacter profundi TaxID=2716883 RepID=UPI001CC35BD7|nr:right-handed parallel beta-helix repeat-containing protein [Flavihumibacter profundi]MBZ5855536.1 right-handed parallel beta-helix repeat-containing protein [Flavihumibacter profundi]